MVYFDYRCKSCDWVFEKKYPLGNPAKKSTCPICKSRKNVVKIIGVPSVSFKGSDFTLSVSENEQA